LFPSKDTTKGTKAPSFKKQHSEYCRIKQLKRQKLQEDPTPIVNYVHCSGKGIYEYTD